MTDDQQLDMIENQVEHILELCGAYTEADQLEDIGNIRALYEEYGEWIETYLKSEEEDGEYITAWCPRLLECDG